MKKNKPVILLVFLALLHINALAQRYAISAPPLFPEEVVQNLKTILSTATGTNFSIEKGPITKGFYLTLDSSLNYKTTESCMANSTGYGLVQFSSPSINGLIFGVYRYLRDAGFSFYLPGELYSEIPAKPNLFARTSKMLTPFTRIRAFFGTGGLGSGKTDPDLSVQKAWQLWKWQNGFGSEFELAGHVGETFNINNRNVLEKHPDWTASPVVVNGNLDPSAKLNYLNPAAVDFFTDWVLKKYTTAGYKAPPLYSKDMVSIDPSDGGGYSTARGKLNGVAINSVSDQVFNAANVAAKKLDKLFPNNPNIGVNLYAYSEHADVPNFPLNPRVFVQLIPYQFQNIAFGPAFLNRWAKKVNQFAIYDYFKYPDANWDLPGGLTLDELMARIIQAVDAGSMGVTYETSYSKFATAIPLWVVARYLADGDKNWKKSFAKITTSLYGNSAAATKLFDMFYRNSQFDAASLKSAYAQVQELAATATSTMQRNRVSELKKYLLYVSSYQDAQNLANGNLEQRLIPFYQLCWSLYESTIIDSYRIMALISYTFLNAPATDPAYARNQQLHLLTFPETNEPGAYWKKPGAGVTDLDADRKLNLAVKTVANGSLAVLSQSDIIKKLKEKFSPVAETYFQSDYTVRGYFNLYAEKPTSIQISWELSATNGAEPSISLSGVNTDYSFVPDEKIVTTKGSKTINLPAGETGLFVNAGPNTTYRLRIQLNGVWIYFNPSPRGNLVFIDNKNQFTYQYPYYPQYFFIPSGTKNVNYSVQSNGVVVRDPSGKPVTTTRTEQQLSGFETRVVDVTTGMDAQPWRMEPTGNYNYQLLNIPNTWYLIRPK